MKEVTRTLDNFIERSNMAQYPNYENPTVFRATIWGAEEYGWPATCPGCKKTHAINTIQGGEEGKRLIIKRCYNCPGSDGKNVYLNADDDFVRDFQKNDYDSVKILKKLL